MTQPLHTGIYVDYANLHWALTKDTAVLSGRTGIEVIAALAAYARAHRTAVIVPGDVKTTVVVLRRKRLLPALPGLRKQGWRVAEVVPHRGPDVVQPDDAELTRLAIADLPELNALVLVAGDGDYGDLVRAARYLGVPVAVAVWGDGLSPRLRHLSDEVIPLHDIVEAGLTTTPSPPLTLPPEKDTTHSTADVAIRVFYAGSCLGRIPVFRFPFEIGRRSVRLGHFPHLDLADFDPARIVSRKHLRLECGSNGGMTVGVYPECSRATWLNGVAIAPGTRATLPIGANLVLGAVNGFGLELEPIEWNNP